MTEDEKLASSVAVDNESIRQNLVKTAVNFLLNPDVMNKSPDSKAAFLKKKGLTEAEIALAFEKADFDPKHETAVALRGNLRNPNTIPPPYPPYQRHYSFWAKLSTVSSSLIVLGVAVYGLQRFYKLYIEPWLFGKESEEGRCSQMEQQLLEMNRSLSQLKRTVCALEETINLQKEQMDKFFQNEVNEYMPVPLAIRDLKTEVGSVKSLLLGRHQFPAMPKVSPIIPVWQLPPSENRSTSSNEGDKEESEKESRDSSSSDKELTEAAVADTVECNSNIVNGSSEKKDEGNDVVEIPNVLESEA